MDPRSMGHQIQGSSNFQEGPSVLNQGLMGQQIQGSSMFQRGSAILQPGSSRMSHPGSYNSHLQGSFFEDQGSLGVQHQRSSEVHEGDIIPMQTIASGGPTPVANASYLSYSSRMPTFTQQRDNLYDPISLDANRGSMQDAGINQAMAKELQNLKDMISSVPGVVRPVPEIPEGSHRLSRFAPRICDTEIPKRFQTPNMKTYDGTTDPEEHVAQYRERMEINPIPERLKEACLCKGFGSSLTGSALKWLLSLPPFSVTSFSHLVNLFNSQFSCSRKFEKLTSDLYRVIQPSDESLRDFVTRFGREALEIPNLDMTTAFEAFKMGIQRSSPFYDDLVITPCRTLDEVRNRELRFIRL
ncbi:uncharacterized protein LOC143636350 [Bidens hawaiensis]|uniref:uncharacterized protein LOC143636350 n=1 Tax=Bidens hawaiensis TaxID=980011 RepID=UPI00404ABDA4